jgi:hypothetical protein
MPLVILHYLPNVFVQLANKRGFKQTNKKNYSGFNSTVFQYMVACNKMDIDLSTDICTCCEATGIQQIPPRQARFYGYEVTTH